MPSGLEVYDENGTQLIEATDRRFTYIIKAPQGVNTNMLTATNSYQVNSTTPPGGGFFGRNFGWYEGVPYIGSSYYTAGHNGGYRQVRKSFFLPDHPKIFFNNSPESGTINGEICFVNDQSPSSASLIDAMERIWNGYLFTINQGVI